MHYYFVFVLPCCTSTNFLRDFLSELQMNTELLTWHFVRTYYEDITNCNVPNVIKKIITAYTYKIIGSDLLSFEIDLKLIQLIQDQVIFDITSFNLLYKGSHHNFSTQKFHEITDTRFNEEMSTITLIVSNFGNIFGGYANKSWKSDSPGPTWNKDINCFLFLLTSNDNENINYPYLFKLKDEKNWSALHCDPDAGPCFGETDIFVSNALCYSRLTSYYSDTFTDVKLCGGNNLRLGNYNGQTCAYSFTVLDYEIWHILH